MRICFISRRFFPAISGMSVYALNLLRELVDAGHDVVMISQYRGDWLGMGVYGGGPPPPVPGVRVIGLEQLGEQDHGDFEADIEAMRQAILAEHARAPFDILHAQYGYPCGWAALLAAHTIHVPTVVSIQGGDGHWVGSCCETHRLAMIRVIRHAGAVLIGCQSFADEVTDRLGVDETAFTIVPGAVDITRFAPRPGQVHTPLTLLYHGRVDARKGVLDLLEALAPLAREQFPFHLLISGIGPTFKQASERIGELGLQHHAEMTGYIDYDAAPSIYGRADIFVSPTYAEGFSNTILEAMASGLAIVSCNAVGVVDCIEHGVTGLLTAPGDVAALTQSLRQILTDGELRQRMAETALSEVCRVYSWKAVGEQIMQVYAGLLGTVPDRTWSDALPMTPCRFRAEPHLL